MKLSSLKLTSLAHRFAAWARVAIFRRRFEHEMDDEIRFHQEEHAATLMARGIPAAEAHRQARLAFGNAESSRDGVRSALGLRLLDQLLGDVRYAVRVLRNSPGFTTVAAVSLAFAIGANTTIFSVAHFLLLERLGVPHASELRMLYRVDPTHSVYHSNWGTWQPGDRGFKIRDTFTYPVYQQMRQSAQTRGTELFAFKDIGTVDASFSGQAQAVQAELVSGNFYEQMRTVPALGRGIQPSDDVAGNSFVAVLSYGFWQRAFGGSPDVLGKTIRIDTLPFTIVGVNARGFSSAASVQRAAEVTLPLSSITTLRTAFDKDAQTLLQRTDENWLQVLVRKSPGTSEAALQQQLDLLYHTAVLATVTPKPGEAVPQLTLEDGSRGTAAWTRQMRKPLHILLALVACVLLLACTNVANLLLARANNRQREITVRLALGAGRTRIFRQLLVESLVLATLGGAAGAALGYLGTRAVPSLLYSAWGSNPAPIPFQWPVLAFTAGITLLTGILFGLAPACRSMQSDVSKALKQGARSASQQRKAWAGKGLIAFQVAVATLLVTGSALFLRTIVNLAHVPPGFDPQNLFLFWVQLPDRQYGGAKSVAFHRDLVERLGALPGIEGASAVSVPLIANSEWSTGLQFEWEQKHSDGTAGAPDRDVDVNDVTPGFFKLMRIPILVGRPFEASDTATSPKVAIVNHAFVRTYLRNRDAIGVRFSGGDRRVDGKWQPDWLTIVGVCGDTQYSDLRSDPAPMYITDKFQARNLGVNAESSNYVLRSGLTASALVPMLKRTVASIDPGLPIVDFRTQTQQIAEISSQERLFATLTAGFGLLALCLASVGIYGVMAYTVSQRTHELGIRLALGAERGHVLRMVLGEAAWIATAGIVIGLACVLSLAQLVRSLLYHLEPRDPASLATATGLLLAVCLLASWVPAVRAAYLTPVIALRQE